MRLDTLHDVLQIVMGWEDYHLHQFLVGERYIGVPPPPEFDDWGAPMEDEHSIKLNQIAPAEKSSFVYEYDFGDGWGHIILVEKILPPEDGVHYPRCVKGKRACPPEDCGGIWGYADLLNILQDPDHSEYEDMREWVGEDFDPEYFNLDEINEILMEL